MSISKYIIVVLSENSKESVDEAGRMYTKIYERKESETLKKGDFYIHANR